MVEKHLYMYLVNVLDLIFADIRNADDSDTEVVINQHDQGSKRCFTKRVELGQGDIYSQKMRIRNHIC